MFDVEKRKQTAASALAVTETKARLEFIEACVKNEEWESIAFLLGHRELREDFRGQIESVAILLPDNFVDYMTREAAYIAEAAFDNRARALTEEVKGLEDNQNTLKSKLELDKAGVEKERESRIKEIQELEDVEVDGARKEFNKLEKELNESKTTRDQVIGATSKYVKTFEKDAKALEGYNKKLSDLDLKITQEKSSVTNTISGWFGGKGDELKQLEGEKAELVKKIDNLKKPYVEVEKTGVMVLGMLPFLNETDKTVTKKTEELSAAKAKLDLAISIRKEVQKQIVDSTNKAFDVRVNDLGKELRDNEIKLKKTQEELKSYNDEKQENIDDYSAQVFENNGVFERGSGEPGVPPLIINNAGRSLLYLTDTNRMKEAMDYLIKYPNPTLQAEFSQLIVEDKKVDEMIKVVASYGNPELSYGVVIDLVSRLDSFAKFEQLIEPLKLNAEQKEDVAMALIGRMELGVSKSILDSIGKGKDFNDQIYDTLINVKEKEAFIKVITGYGVAGKFEALLDTIAGIDDEAKRSDIALKLLDVKNVEGVDLINKLKLTPDSTLKLMDKLAADRGNFREAYEILKGNVEPKVLEGFAAKHVKTLDDLLFYAGSFENKIDGSSKAGKLLSDRMLKAQRDGKSEPISFEIVERSMDGREFDKIKDTVEKASKKSSLEFPLDKKLDTACILADAYVSTKANLATFGEEAVKAVEKELNANYQSLGPEKIPHAVRVGQAEFNHILKEFGKEGAYDALKIAVHNYRKNTVRVAEQERLPDTINMANVILYEPDLARFNDTRYQLNKITGFGEELTLGDEIREFFAPLLELIGYMPNPNEIMKAAAYVVGLVDSRAVNKELRESGGLDAAKDAIGRLGGKPELPSAISR